MDAAAATVPVTETTYPGPQVQGASDRAASSAAAMSTAETAASGRALEYMGMNATMTETVRPRTPARSIGTM